MLRCLKDAKRTALLAAPAAALAVFAAGAAGAGHPSFVPSAVVAAGSQVIDAAVADFNGDGRPDLAVASASDRPNDVSVLLGDSAGGFSPGPGSPVKLRGAAEGIVTADFNGDGKVDVAVRWRSDESENKVSVLLGDGAGRFGPAVGSRLESGLAAAADVNGDGKVDLVGLEFGVKGGQVAVLLGDGSGRFAPALRSRVAAGSAVHVADFNGDGHADLAVAGEGVWILAGTGSGRFRAAKRVSKAHGPIAVADFNGDAKLDLAVAGAKTSILLGSGAGAFKPAPASSFKGDAGEGLLTADFNGDGKADLATASGAGSVAVLLGDGSGRFHKAGSPVVLPFDPGLAAATDLNGDGKPDLLAYAFPLEEYEAPAYAEASEARLAILAQASSPPVRLAAHGRALPASAGLRMTTPRAITKLAADGNRVAALTDRVVVWNTPRAKAIEFKTPCSPGPCSEYDGGVAEIALGAGQVAWITSSTAGNTQGWLAVFAAKLSGGAAKRIDFTDRARVGIDDNGGSWRGHLHGGGPVLAYNSWGTRCSSLPDDDCVYLTRSVTAPSLVRIAGRRRHVVKRGAGSYRLAAAGGGRMAVESGDGTVSVLAPSGARAATLPAANGDLPRGIALGRTHLAVTRWSGALDLYSPRAGKRTKSIPLGPAAALELVGVSARLALLRGTGRLVLARLGDGKLISLPLPGVADAKLTESGLFYAYNTPKAAMKGHIVFEPTAKLLARF